LYARQIAVLQARGRPDFEQAALAECLRRVPQFAPVWDDGLSGIQRQLRAVKALPGRCHEVFELYKATGCTQEQIAAQLSMTVEEVLVALAAAARAWARSYSGHPQRSTNDIIWELSEPTEITVGLQPLLN
jgi:DNA-directed RNA polymerase specialized sigma24 family protein